MWNEQLTHSVPFQSGDGFSQTVTWGWNTIHWSCQRIITNILREFICKTIVCVNYKIRKISHGQRNALRKSSTLWRFEPAWVKFKLACDQYQPHRAASAFNHAVRWVCQLSQDYCYAELADNSLVTAETIASIHCAIVERWTADFVGVGGRLKRSRYTGQHGRSTLTAEIVGRHSVSGIQARSRSSATR